ncbi:MAG: ADP-ribosyltransferase exoenzyme [Euryarchaeota archaeon ADurb.BinA087]|nr:MAG: ADP-ribosyltransferase exoenzyme [Euryarchaeota archaeon ADurb.BinA087]HNQ26028.1 ADP-ribosyltransferase [Methanoregulaceae archaeon]HQA80324.1 ADP-ribosyltransferase [Methanoregulaceae archaeon]
MTENELQRIPWEDRDDLTPQEKEAVAFYLEYSSEVQYYLRHPRELSGLEESPNFEALVHHLDNTICRSPISAGTLVYRGVRADYSKRLLFLLSIDFAECNDGFHSITPQIIRDLGFTSFTMGAERLVSKKREDPKILLVHQTTSAENALFIGGEDAELLYPRAYPWLVTGFTCSRRGRETMIFINLASYQGGIS